MIDNILDNIKARAQKKYNIVGNFIALSIAEANQILYGLSLTLAHEEISIVNKNIHNLIKSFDHKIDRYRYRSIPLDGFKVLDSNDVVILNSLLHDKVFTPSKISHDLELLAAAKNNPFELQIGRMRLGRIIKELIIPVCMSIEQDRMYKGTICSGLLVKNLSSQLDHHIKDRNIVNVELLPLDGQENNNTIKNSFTTINIIMSALKDENLIMYLPLKSYNALLKAEISCYYLSEEIGEVIFFSACYFVCLLLLIHIMFAINKKFYQQPFDEVMEKLYKQSNIFSGINSELYKSLKTFCPHTLSKIMEHIIDHCSSLHQNIEKVAREKPAEELRKNILHLILTDYHYNKLCKCDVEPGILYLNELDRLVDEKEEAINLKDFLEELIHYCSEYYSDLKLRLIIEDNAPLKFISKKSFLSESLFNIFAAITRIGKLSTEDPIVLRSSFCEDNLPSFSIEVIVSDFLGQPLGWESGLSYTCTGLLAIHLLAKNNNYFFFIEQENNKIIFKLQPFDDKKLKSTNEMLSQNYPLNLISTKQS